ncbi:uncharacterized protein [Venturia canescens]|uniref:uncharacterized protein n=1 Tax=Venturia canescens TaxID=32260 RepID=UPI001C9C835A|nr:uncharacterized protein LOC122408404 [Venturia canescens]
MESENVEILREAERTEEPEERLSTKFNMDVNLGINLSILIILMIFCGLLFLPAKMLLDTSYEVGENENSSETEKSILKTNFLSSMKFREKKICPGLNYEYWLSSIFFSNYDRNCTYTRKRVIAKDKETRRAGENKNSDKSICSEDKKMINPIVNNYNGTFEEMKASKPKSVPVTGHILAMMLVVSAVAAFVEVLRIRFINPKDTSTVETAGSRKGSTVELMSHGRFLSRPTIKPQRSFDLQGMQRSAQRLIGTRPPPLTRRSSFPSYHAATMDLAMTNDPSISRRTSINPESAPDSGMASIHRRARLIRRH